MTEIFGVAVQGKPPPMERGSGPQLDYLERCLPDFGLVCSPFQLPRIRNFCFAFVFSKASSEMSLLKECIIICSFYACFLSCKFKFGVPFWTFLNSIYEHVTSFIAFFDANKGVFC